MLNRTAQCAVRELHGLGVDNLTADEIVDLHILGEAQERAGKRVHSVIDTTSCEVGNVVLYPPTCVSADWYSTAIEWFKDKPETSWCALPFALANGRKAGYLESLNTESKSSVAIAEWIATVTATRAEIDEAVGNVIDIKTDCDRHAARVAFLEALTWIERNDSELADKLSGLALHAFDATKPINALEGTPDSLDVNEHEYDRWRKTCAELAALTGGSIDEWYRQDVRLVLHAYKTASDSEAIRAGVRINGQPHELIDAIRAFRAKVAEIANVRKERISTNG